MAVEIAPCLKLLFSASLHQGKVPLEWKKALVTPLFGNRRDPLNYQPVSLTCICSKLMEHIIFSNIMSHVETQSHQILSDMQFGFRKRRSVELQLLQTIHDLSFNLNNRGQTDTILLDFSKAFDKVSHQLLLFKLEYYGIRGNILNWISSFLSGRTQRVMCEDCISDSVARCFKWSTTRFCTGSFTVFDLYQWYFASCWLHLPLVCGWLYTVLKNWVSTWCHHVIKWFVFTQTMGEEVENVF